MHSDHENEGATFEECFLGADRVDYDAVNQLAAEDFAMSSNDWKHHARYLISKILSGYFPTSTRKQKIRHSDGRLLPKYTEWPTPLPDIQFLDFRDYRVSCSAFPLAGSRVTHLPSGPQMVGKIAACV